MSEQQLSHIDGEYEEFVLGDLDPPAAHDPPASSAKCNQVSCAAQDQNAFCVPLSFDQVLITATGGTTGMTGITPGMIIPLSTVARNVDGVKGTLKLKFNNSLSKAAYALYVFNATSQENRITSAALYLAPAGATGPMVVPLYLGPPRVVNGLLIKGTIDNRSIIPAAATDSLPAVNNVASLYQAIREGVLYASVNSDRFPNGVIRGQIYLKHGYASSK
jgi:hypothetical protein